MYKAKSPGNKEHVFAQVPEANIPRSVFNRSHGVKTTFQEGNLIPFLCDEALPGDTFSVKSTLYCRMNTPIAPLYDNLYLNTYYFAVPMRLVWDNFKYFMGEKVNPDDTTSYTIPQIVSPAGGWLEESLSDYLGLPIKVAGLSVSSLFHRSYNKIYNEWFRDQNLIDSAVVDLDNGADNNTDYVIRKVAKMHDYFTSALPLPQKGTAVSLGLGTTAPVLGIGSADQNYSFGAQTVYESDGTTSVFANTKAINHTDVKDRWFVEENGVTGYPNIRADLTTATAITINSLREAFQLQKMLERDMRGGTRYVEIIKAHFGVTSPDARMQRSEYLGGDSVPIVVTPVPQLSSTTGSYAQGHLAGYATGISMRGGFSKSFTEHCLILGLLAVKADLHYQQGIPRMFSRSTKYDFYWPALSCLGEQAILNKEIYAQATGDDALTFGYQERYAEYRYKPSQITGKLRSTASSPLDVWHLAQKFTSLPVLDQTFIEETAPMSRVVAVAGSDFTMDGFVSMRCARPMPLFGVPGLIDHF